MPPTTSPWADRCRAVADVVDARSADAEVDERVEVPVADEARRRRTEDRRAVGRDLRPCARGAPDAHLVDGAPEVLGCAGQTGPDHERFCVGAERDREGRLAREHAVDVEAHEAAADAYGHVLPDAERERTGRREGGGGRASRYAGVEEDLEASVAARRERPRRPGNAFRHDAAVLHERRWLDPRFERDGVREREGRLVGHLDAVVDAVEDEVLRVEGAAARNAKHVRRLRLRRRRGGEGERHEHSERPAPRHAQGESVGCGAPHVGGAAGGEASGHSGGAEGGAGGNAGGAGAGRGGCQGDTRNQRDRVRARRGVAGRVGRGRRITASAPSRQTASSRGSLSGAAPLRSGRAQRGRRSHDPSGLVREDRLCAPHGRDHERTVGRIGRGSHRTVGWREQDTRP